MYVERCNERQTDTQAYRQKADSLFFALLGISRFDISPRAVVPRSVSVTECPPFWPCLRTTTGILSVLTSLNLLENLLVPTDIDRPCAMADAKEALSFGYRMRSAIPGTARKAEEGLQLRQGIMSASVSCLPV